MVSQRLGLLMILYVTSVTFDSGLAFTSVDDAYTLHTDLFSKYNKNIRPVLDQDTAINASVALYIKSIQGVDEVHEKYSFGAALWVNWQDDLLTWNESDYNGLWQITTSYDDVWVPDIILASPSKRITVIGRSLDRIRIYSSGYVEWTPVALIESTCAINVKNYPFDTQTCKTSFVSLGYTNTEVELNPMFPKIQTDAFSPNALWEMTDSDVITKVLASGEASELIFTIYLKRKSTLVVINIIMPILLLSMVNIFVFLLAPESGERIGYSITTLLAIAVYMTIVSDMLPQNPESIPLISYKLFVDLLISVLIVLCTIVNLGLYHTDDAIEVPNWLQSMYRKLACSGYGQRKVQPRAAVHNGKAAQHEDVKAIGNKDGIGTCPEFADDLSITWKKISKMFDWIALIMFTLFNSVNFVVYIVIAKRSSA